MAVPESIRSVLRPVNTIVQDTGRDGIKRYIVRERKSEKYIPGGNPQPVNGKTIGYIFGGRFVSAKEKMFAAKPQMLSFGMSCLVKQLSSDIIDDLCSVYDPKDAYTIFAMSAIKVIRPHVSGSRMASAYESCFISHYYPGLSLSKNSVCQMNQNLGKDGAKREAFFEKRLAKVMENHHIAIDGTLKQDTGKINDLSAFSHKARLKGCEDISILYAYDIELKEPICAQVFPGNSIDAVSYRTFIENNQIKRGIIIADKGFPPNNIRDVLNANPNLHYITPLKRNDKRIEENEMLSFDGILPDREHAIQYKKVSISEGIYLYAFRDSVRAAAEEKTFLSRMKVKKIYNQTLYNKKSDQFGLIVFESDQDLDPSQIYNSYDSRWDLELVFKAYKSDDCLDRTAVQGDFSIYGSEFVNFISTLISCRILAKATAADLFSEMSYRDLVEDLNSAWRKTEVPEGTEPTTGDIFWVHTIPRVFEILEKLGISKPKEHPAPKKRGRKQNAKNEKSEPLVEECSNGEKRKRGRPRKNRVEEKTEKRPVGRPRIRSLPDPNVPKRPVGRPKKQTIADITVEKE